jgi:hypothetical protein
MLLLVLLYHIAAVPAAQHREFSAEEILRLE